MTDIYQEVRVMAQRMKQCGLEAVADDLLQSLVKGATAGEIMMMVRHTLRQVMVCTPAVDVELSQRIDALVLKLIHCFVRHRRFHE